MARWGCKALAALATSNEANAARVDEAGGVLACGRSLQRLPYSIDVASSVLEALAAVRGANRPFTRGGEGAKEAMVAWLQDRDPEERKAVTMGLCGAMDAFPERAEIQEQCRAYVNITDI